MGAPSHMAGARTCASSRWPNTLALVQSRYVSSMSSHRIGPHQLVGWPLVHLLEATNSIADTSDQVPPHSCSLAKQIGWLKSTYHLALHKHRESLEDANYLARFWPARLGSCHFRLRWLHFARIKVESHFFDSSPQAFSLGLFRSLWSSLFFYIAFNW